MNNEHIEIPKPQIFSINETNEILSRHHAKGFNIPIYQRLYAWSRKEIEKLLEDFAHSCKEGKEEYYIGNLTLYFNPETGDYDLIDGQQRMTSLWLLTLVLNYKDKNNSTNNLSLLQNEYGVILKFIAREDDNAFLKSLIESKGNQNIIKSGAKTNQMMIEALNTMDSFLSDKLLRNFGLDIQKFTHYVFHNVKIAAVFLPEGIDLNKYFEDMNNRGLQLESQHILKARLLKHVEKDSQITYAKVWDAISQMNQYVEYGFEDTLKVTRAKLHQEANFFAKNDTSDNDQKEESLKDLLSVLNYKKQESNHDLDKYIGKVRSVINFEEFLLHCLRLFKNDTEKSISIDDKKLLDIFKKQLTEDKFAEFIEFVFKVRILFDKYLVKSVETQNGTNWEIRTIEKKEDEEEFERKKHLSDELVQIQSMLSVSTSNSLWLTDTLKYLLEEEFDIDIYFAKLSKIDNVLHPLIEHESLNRGTSTDRYWFFKLDYILWLNWYKNNQEIPSLNGVSNSKIRTFQFRENRSVEHIHPRHPITETWLIIDKDELAKTKNRFGNLALISVSSNSSYKHQSFENKKIDFIKKSKNRGIESLKLFAVYAQNDWSIDKMNKHTTKMYSFLQEYYRIS